MEDAEETEAPDDEVFINVENSLSRNSEDGRHTWLREARSLCGDDLESLASEAAEDFPITPRLSEIEDQDSLLLGEPLDDDIICQQRNGIAAEENNVNKINKKEDDEKQLIENSNDENTISTSDKSTDNIDTNSSNENSFQKNESAGDFHKKLEVDEKMSAIISKTVQEDDYVFQASVAMSNAIEQEELGNFESAFDMYKFGIGLLLCGVQTDTDNDRRDAVRRKTAQYLLRAETLYKSAFTNSKNSENSKSEKKELSLDGKWRFRLSDVKVIGLIDKVMLVQRMFSKEDDVFVMKVLHKIGAEYKRNISNNNNNNNNSKNKNNNINKPKRNLYNTQFMCLLVNCVETKTGVYLLLEHVHGGRLWDFLGMKIFSSPRRSSSFASNDTTHQSLDNLAGNQVENIDIVDIPATSYVRQGSNALASRSRESSVSSSIACKIKRSPSKSHNLDESQVCMWAAQVASALMDLHNKGVLCR